MNNTIIMTCWLQVSLFDLIIRSKTEPVEITINPTFWLSNLKIIYKKKNLSRQINEIRRLVSHRCPIRHIIVSFKTTIIEHISIVTF